MLRHAVSIASITPYPDTYTSSNRVSDELECTTPHQPKWPAVYLAAIPGPTEPVPRAAGTNVVLLRTPLGLIENALRTY